MGWNKTKLEFDQFAEAYEQLFGKERSSSRLTPLCHRAIDQFKPRQILDCACGPGWQAVSLVKEGYRVIGTDISSQMIRLAKRNARAAQVKVQFKVSAWHELPKKLGESFDFVMCHGNAIGHCAGEKSMVESLKAMRKLMSKGDHFYVDTRSWEWFRNKSPKYWLGSAPPGSEGEVVLYRGEVPRLWSEPHRMEIIRVIGGDSKREVKSYTVTFFAFKRSEFMKRLHLSGFEPLEVETVGDGMGYYVLARAI